MKVVGLDFGTTNVRISLWDSERDAWGQDEDGAGPQPQMIGEGGTSTMPAVIALRRQPDGTVSILVGEEADQEEDIENEVLVIRNIKRCALSNDSYIEWHLQVRDDPRWPPKGWNPEAHCFEFGENEFPVWHLIERILEEAFNKAGISAELESGEFEWRAGCPVHSGLDYRTELTRVLRNLTGKGNIRWVVEEPTLFLTLAHRRGLVRPEGSYMVYDLGGGSFDCALVQIDRDQMLVYGADGHPLLGGSDIDKALQERLSYGDERPHLLRQAKESIGPANSTQDLGGGITLTNDDMEAVLADGGFVNRSLMTMHDAYIAAKCLWKREQDQRLPPIGEVATVSPDSDVFRFVWQLTWEEMARDLDGILLFGGPTRHRHFRERLAKRFGHEKVSQVSDVFPELVDAIGDLDLVGISMGACYAYDDYLTPLYLNRLPGRITLEDMESGDKVEYEPFQHLTKNFTPLTEFVSAPLRRQDSATQSTLYPQSYELTVTAPSGVVFWRTYLDEIIDSRLMNHTLRLVIDPYGLIGVQQEGAKRSPQRFLVFDGAPWLSYRQQEARGEYLQRMGEYQGGMPVRHVGLLGTLVKDREYTVGETWREDTR